jgi:hypothetical protein
MPVFESIHWTDEIGDTLEGNGPIIAVEIGIPEALEKFRLQNGLSIPPRYTGFALIDTGASISAVHEEILKGLDILPVDAIPSRSPHGTSRSLVYPTRVSFPTIAVKDQGISRVIGCDLKWETHDRREIIMLVGRDLLKHFLVVYNGISSVVTLAY